MLTYDFFQFERKKKKYICRASGIYLLENVSSIHVVPVESCFWRRRLKLDNNKSKSDLLCPKKGPCLSPLRNIFDQKFQLSSPPSSGGVSTRRRRCCDLTTYLDETSYSRGIKNNPIVTRPTVGLFRLHSRGTPITWCHINVISLCKWCYCYNSDNPGDLDVSHIKTVTCW